MKLVDTHNRIHDYLRISLTDKCNLNCSYCNPNGNDFNKLKNSELLTNNELMRLIKIFVVNFEFKKIRLTGGEPLVRLGIEELFNSISSLKSKYKFELGITTNGTFLYNKLEFLKENGLDKLNISLDTLDRVKYNSITSLDGLSSVLSSVDKAITLGFNSVKINSVIMKGVNDDEIIDLVKFAINKNLEIRFIEYMPFSSNGWNDNNFLSTHEIKSRVQKVFNLIRIKKNLAEVADTYAIKGGKGRVGFISSISNHFCGDCNRLRITATGLLKLCLFSSKKNEYSLKTLLRSDNISDSEMANIISASLQNKKLEHPAIDELLNLESNNMLEIGG